MSKASDPSTLTAQALLDSGAFLLRPDEPFVLTSGMKAPFYINCRRLIFHPQSRTKIAEAFAEMIRQKLDLSKIDVIAGGVTAGVPFATLVADRLEKPLVYIRPEPKKHGTGSQIEGGEVSGQHVLLIEDLTTTAKSVLAFTKILRDAGATVSDACLVFSRATPEAHAELDAVNITMHVLSGMDVLLELARSQGVYSDADLSEAYAFLEDANAWSKARGGAVR